MNKVSRNLIWSALYVSMAILSLWVLARYFGIWFTMNNEEANHHINFVWFDVGPFAFFPSLVLSMLFRRAGGVLLVGCGLIFLCISLFGKPFSLSAQGLLFPIFQIGVPMVIMGLLRIRFRHRWFHFGKRIT